MTATAKALQVEHNHPLPGDGSAGLRGYHREPDHVALLLVSSPLRGTRRNGRQPDRRDACPVPHRAGWSVRSHGLADTADVSLTCRNEYLTRSHIHARRSILTCALPTLPTIIVQHFPL